MDPRFGPRTDLRTRVLSTLERAPVLRSSKAQRTLRSWQREVRRWRRRRAEARGDDSRSRPALHDLDRRLQPYLGAPGFFVEAGAHDGFTHSNTYYLERFRGWRGLLVEPIPEFCWQAMRERPASRVANCALVAPERAGTPVCLHQAGPMSFVHGARGDQGADAAYLAAAAAFPFSGGNYSVNAPGRTLSELLDEMEAPPVDFLSLDLEGYEDQALAGLDLSRHAPALILVEVHDDEALGRIQSRLGARYRILERLSPMDVLFERVGRPVGSPALQR